MTEQPNETSPLLASPTNQAEQRATRQTWRNQSSTLTTWLASLPLTYRLAPIVFLALLGNNLPVTTALDLMERVICLVWYYLKDPDAIPPNGEIPREWCRDRVGPAAAFSWYLSIQALNLSFCSFIAASLSARFGARFGRKPVLLVILTGSGLSLGFFLSALFVTSSRTTFVLVLLWQLLDAICSPFTLIMTLNIMLVDSLEPNQRTSAFAVIQAFFSAGSAPAFALGGTITTKTGNPMYVVIVSLSVLVLSIFLAIILAPETFKAPKREAFRQERAQRATLARQRSSEREIIEEGYRFRRVRRVARRTAKGALSIFEPLMRLKPTRNSKTGQLNIRAPVIGVAYFLSCLGMGYFGPALMAHMIVVLHGNEEQNGRVLSVVAICQVLGLAFVVPAIMRWGRPWYSRRHPTHRQATSTEDTLDHPSSEQTSSHFDVYLVGGSLIADGFVLLLIGHSDTRTQLMMVSPFISLGVGARAATQSIAAASVAPIVSGDILAAMTMISHIAGLASPIMLGYVNSKFITTNPSTVFVIMASLMLASATLIPLVRDEDRYIESRDGQARGTNSDQSQPERQPASER